MSPQQRAGMPASPADDLYALGVLLVELLRGTPPGAPLEAPGEDLATLPVPERLRGLLAALLAHEPEARPVSAAAVRDELDEIARELGGLPRPEPRRERRAVRLQPPPRLQEVPAPSRAGAPAPTFGQREARPSRMPLVILGGLVLLALAAVVWLPRWAEEPAPARQAPSLPAGEATAASAAPAATATPAARVAEHQPAEAPPEPHATEAPARAPLALPSPRTEPGPPRARDPQPIAPNVEKLAATPPEPEAPAPPTPDPQAEARALAEYRAEAARLEAREEWKAALQQYEAALRVDPFVSFAVEGRERAQKHARVVEALDFHLQRPERLSATAVAKEAEAVLERARGLEPRGAALAARIAALEAALVRARTPIAVEIESDGLTELSLSRVGPLGTLTRRSLQLMPGRYTLTGSRRGYRDVRREFEVEPGAPGPTLSVHCTEAL